MEQNELAASVRFRETGREAGHEQMEIIQKDKELRLYGDRITAPSAEFRLSSVWDVSFKSFSDGSGLLYLHTDKGISVFRVMHYPDRFFAEFRRLKGRL